MANDMTIIDSATGEVLVPDLSTLETTTKAEIDALVSTAKKYPRPKFAVIRDVLIELATMDETTAEEMRYALPRGKNQDGTAKVISGPSIRFMEICAQQYGNCQVGVRITEINRKDKYVEAEGVFIDSQTNVRQVARVRRRISGRDGRVFNDDMIQTTSNAAASIARRNAIAMGVPKAVWNPAYLAAEEVITGNAVTLSNTRAKAIAAFTNFGLDEAAVFSLIGAERVEDIGKESVADLRAMFRQLKNQETTVEELLRNVKGEPAAVTHEVTSNPLKDDDGPAPQKASEAPAATESEKAPETATAPAEKLAPLMEGEKLPEEKKPKATAKKKADKEPEAAAPAKEDDSPLPEVKDGKVVGAAAADAPALPKTEKEYDLYARTWIDNGDSATDLMERWKSERRLRNECGVTSETLEPLKEYLDGRVADL